MVDWQDPAVIATEADALLKLTNVLVGIYYWEFLISLDFEWSFIRGQRKFKWPMIFYFLNRYCLLVSFTMILIPVFFRPTNCHAIYHFLEIIGNMCAAFSSLILALRTMAIWVDNLYIKGCIILLILGQWVILLQGDNIQADWVRGTGCVFTATGNQILAAFFIYTMCLDFSILLLTAWKLVRPAFWRFSPMAQLLFQDGLVYFILVFFSNFIVAVFEILNLNTVMNIMFNAPSVLVATVCVSVRSPELLFH
ncbi:hypothetical protein K474DRAFT_1605713 [Panus rudis PR-1116 ss-1]|nr:hypothetical protein K474DRAFT_1605713 [Panus rudis PR-1116 ss-1]